MQKTKPEILFVDDDQAIRATLPLVLESFGFKVTSAANTRDAIRLIANQQFDVLIADLNIDRQGDGFTIVSAMRSTRPEAVTFILTGYPAFEAALDAIRQQVDDYFLKPAEASQIVQAIEDKLHNKRPAPRIRPRRLADLVGQNRDRLVKAWLSQIGTDLHLAAIKLPELQRQNYAAGLLDEAVAVAKGGDINADTHGAAAQHGQARAKQGYTFPMLLREARALHKVLALFVQEHLSEIAVDHLVSDMTRIYDTIDLLAEESAQSFLQQASLVTKEKRSA
jgi:ActR/RegA family two-component response regulator